MALHNQAGSSVVTTRTLKRTINHRTVPERTQELGNETTSSSEKRWDEPITPAENNIAQDFGEEVPGRLAGWGSSSLEEETFWSARKHQQSTQMIGDVFGTK
ncbi:hypothetical protein Q1695_015625 [Nippostrongylus brasiliensis]|nr:hypothetical protein Q1695_015625 [Nippostrongylus brasiliensis]